MKRTQINMEMIFIDMKSFTVYSKTLINMIIIKKNVYKLSSLQPLRGDWIWRAIAKEPNRRLLGWRCGPWRADVDWKCFFSSPCRSCDLWCGGYLGELLALVARQSKRCSLLRGRHGKLTGDCVLVIEAKLVRLLKRVIVSPDLPFEMVISRSLLLSGQSLLFVAWVRGCMQYFRGCGGGVSSSFRWLRADLTFFKTCNAYTQIKIYALILHRIFL